MGWTLTLGAVTQSLAAWGITSMGRERRNQEPDVLVFTIDGHGITTAAPFAVDDILTLKFDSTVWFVGRCKTPDRYARGGNEGLRYTAENVWGELGRRAFLQSAKQYTGLVDDEETYATYYTSHCILFASANVDYDPNLDGKATLGAVLEEILDYAIAGGASVQYVALELSALTIIGPSTPLTDPRCSDAIREALRWCPDCVVWFDYTTSPVTIHFTPRASMSTATLAIGDAGAGVTAVQLTPRDDMAVPFVYIKYEQTNTEDGKSWISIAPDNITYAGDLYPTAAYPDGLGAMDGLVLTVDLQGSTISTVSGTVASAALPAGSSPSAGWKTWLASRCTWLNATEITSWTMDALSFVGTPLAFVLLPGSCGVADWMRTGGGAAAEVNEVTVKVRATLTVAGDIQVTRDIDVRISTTNLTSGSYSLRQLDEAGEPVPSGLAQYLYTQMSAGHWEGQVVTEAAECAGTVRPGQLLRVTSGLTAWATMDAVVHSVSEDIGTGQTVINVGPNKWLSAGEILGWLKKQRENNRSGKRAWNTLSTGLASSGLGAVDLPAKTPIDAPSGGALSYEKFSLRELNTGANTVNTAKGQIALDRADACDGSSANGKLVKVREIKCAVRDLAGVSKQRLLAVVSDGYDSAIHADELELLAGVKMFKLQTSGDGDDVVTCKEWTGSAETGSALSVAKPFALRIAQQPSEDHFTMRPYADGEIVFAVEPAGGTGVSNVTWLDLNVDARAWAATFQVCSVPGDPKYADLVASELRSTP
jgi:hypothetical protein